MEQDKQLKNILLNSAESVSADFTDKVMQKVQGLAAASSRYQPLVSAKLARLFIFIFGAVIAAFLGVWLLLALSNVHVVTWIQNRSLPDVEYSTIFMFILSFWAVFALNSIIEKKFFLRKDSHLEV